MSSIYIQEPPTNGKICLKTTVGDIDIELWSKECPKACRNFVQLCMEGYYIGTIFHRVVPDFIAQGGDPTGSGLSGESIFGKPFKDEFHSRLRFVRRGLVAMANGGPNDNGSQFFFTLGTTPELQNKHTIFGQVTGKTLYNMLKLGEGEIDKNERPLYPQKILSVEILANPFPDIIPRILPKNASKDDEDSAKKESSIKATKNFNLLSFGDEAEEEEEMATGINKAFSSKGKSAHDLAKDERLSHEPAVRKEEMYQKGDRVSDVDESTNDERTRVKNEVMKKLEKLKSKNVNKNKEKNPDDQDDDNLSELITDEKLAEQKSQVDTLKAEFKQLQKEMAKNKKREEAEITEMKPPDDNPAIVAYHSEKEKYKNNQLNAPKRKTTQREASTLALLEKFQEKLNTVIESSGSEKQTIPDVDIADDEEVDIPGDSWMAHKFVAEDEELKQAKDANVKSDEMFDIYDPRNPMNKRRRETDSKDKRKHKK